MFSLLKHLDAGTLTPRPLHDFGRTGDLTDYGKIIVALPGEPEHQTVVKGQNGTFTVTEVVAVEDRTQGLPYRHGKIVRNRATWGKSNGHSNGQSLRQRRGQN